MPSKTRCVQRHFLWALGMFVCVATATFAQADAQPKKKQAVEPALGGYCPACYVLDRKAVEGKPEFQTVFRGRVYFHSSEDRKTAFEKEPDRYLPQFDGLCTVALGGSYGNRLPGDPTVFTIDDGNVYLFSSLRAYRAYHEDPPQFRVVAHDRFSRPEVRGYCVVSYQAKNQAVRGEIRTSAAYDGKLFYFSDAPAKKMFDADPERYVPRYDGHDPVSLADRTKVRGDPRLFIVKDKNTFIFLNEESKKKFEGRPDEIIRKADEAWAMFAAD